MPRQNYSRLYKIPDDEFKKYVSESKTFTEILTRCGEEFKNINTIKRRITKMNLDVSHIPSGRRHNSGRRFPKEELSLEVGMSRLTTSSKWKRVHVKNFIIKHSLIPYVCECGVSNRWREKPISLQLEHKNGIANDNRLDNLCFLCPNCHSQTMTFSGKKLTKTFLEYDTLEFRRDCKTMSRSDLCEKYKITTNVLYKIISRLSISMN